MAGAKLTLKMQRFVDEYLEDLNATQAVLRAGYKMTEKAAAVQGTRLLRKANVQEALREAREARQSKLTVNAAWVLEQIAQIAKDEDTATRDRLKALEMLSKHFGLLEKQTDPESQGVKVTFEAEMEGWSE